MTDLSTPKAAFAYLRNLPGDREISLPGRHDPTTTISDAIRVIAGEPAHLWAVNRQQWDWTISDLIVALLDWGLSNAKLAELLGCSTHKIFRLRKRCGHPNPGSVGSPLGKRGEAHPNYRHGKYVGEKQRPKAKRPRTGAVDVMRRWIATWPYPEFCQDDVTSVELTRTAIGCAIHNLHRVKEITKVGTKGNQNLYRKAT
jgi:hypothetical protein